MYLSCRKPCSEQLLFWKKSLGYFVLILEKNCVYRGDGRANRGRGTFHPTKIFLWVRWKHIFFCVQLAHVRDKYTVKHKNARPLLVWDLTFFRRLFFSIGSHPGRLHPNPLIFTQNEGSTRLSLATKYHLPTVSWKFFTTETKFLPGGDVFHFSTLHGQLTPMRAWTSPKQFF